jgi:hypothetical protein
VAAAHLRQILCTAGNKHDLDVSIAADAEMNNVPHVKLHLNKRSLKLSGQTYAVQQKKLERVLAEQLEDLELKEQATAAKRTREQVCV